MIREGQCYASPTYQGFCLPQGNAYRNKELIIDLTCLLGRYSQTIMLVQFSLDL